MYLRASCLCHLLLYIVSYTLSLVHSCQVHLCYNEYTQLASGYTKLQQPSLVRSLATRDTLVREYCVTLQAYSVCMKGLSRSCRGKLDYHAVIAHVNKWINDYNCTGTAKARSPSKSSFNLALRQQADKNSDYPWTGSSSITHASPPKVRRKSKKCRKHTSHLNQRNLPESNADTYSSSAARVNDHFVIISLSILFIFICVT